MSERRSRPRRLLDRLRRRAPGRDGDIEDLVASLLARPDTISQRDDAAAVAAAYVALDDDGRLRFLEVLARDFWSDPHAVDEAMARVGAAVDPGARRAAQQHLREVLTPPAARLLHLFTGLDDGVKLLVELRADLLALGEGRAELADLDRELRAHLTTVFDVGLLALRRITWDAPASLLEKLIAYEAVHAIDSWGDLKNRLDSDRRCYAFFHPAMPDEPLVFVEIALTAGVATELDALLDEAAPELDPAHADTAVFYSISSCQPGLAGVNLGNALIKQVVEELRRDLPHVRRYVTLSPVPGFRLWLAGALRAPLSPRERELLPAEPERVLARLDDDDWSADESVRPALLALCARYLTTVVDGRVLDPVANFHLANGASIDRVNWGADPSPAGRARSAGIMVNYLYEPDRIRERAAAYAARGEVAVAPAVRELVAE
jgi:malonyl-CoA decarboxylase